MGCSTSRDAAAGGARPRPRPRRRVEEAAKLCRERAKLARAVADRRSALAAAHAAYFRSLAAVAFALRRFADAALAPPPAFALPPSPVAAATATATVSPILQSSPSPTASSLSHHSLPDENLEPPRPNANRGGGDDGKTAASSSTTTTRTRHCMRSSPTVPAVVYENPYARPGYAEGEASHGDVDGEEAPPEITPWDFFDPFAHCDGFAEDYLSRRRDLPDDDSAELRKAEGVPELEEDTESSAATAEDRDASSKPSTSTATTAGDQNTKAKTPAAPDNAASNSDPSGGGNGAAGKRPAAPSHISSKEGAKVERAVPAPPGANGGGTGKAVSSKEAAPSNNGTSEKSNPEREKKKKKMTSPASLKGTVNTDGTGGNTSSSRAAGRGGGDGGEPSARPAATTTTSPPTRSVAAAMDEVYWLFNEAANRGVAVARVLGKGKSSVVPCRAKLRVLTVSTTSCLPKRQQRRKPRASTSRRSTSSLLGAAGRTNGALKFSSTLEKIWLWENKLCREIEDKEKLRKQYKKTYKRLKSMEDRGVESSTIDSTQESLNDLRSKISVSVSTANVLKVMIQKVRDEELYPQLADLVQRFRALWKAVMECHEKQLSAIQGTEMHRLKAVTLSQSSVASIASEELEKQLINWRRCFDKWTGSQKSFVQALNRWMVKPLPEAQEETRPDGVTQQLEPLALVISKNWLQATETVSTAEVLRSMDHFSKLVREFKKSQEGEQRHKQKAERSSRDYITKREDLKVAYGLITGHDVAAVMENPYYKRDECVRNLVKARRRRDDERARHDEILQHAHVAASATLPLGLVPMLQQIISFFQGNLQAYTQIGIQGT
ncbi:hypothetical protein EJB05_01324, partial [Eragrostis curvula]